MELPDAIVLCARRGFEKVAVEIDPQLGVLAVVRDGAPGDGQAATLRHAGLVLDCGPAGFILFTAKIPKRSTEEATG